MTKKSGQLFCIWRSLLILFSMAMSIYTGYLEGILGENVRAMPSQFQLLLIAIILFLFLPSLLFIRNKSMAEKDAKVLRKSTKFAWILGLAGFGALICNIFAILLPNVV